MEKVVIAGGTGFIGTFLTRQFNREGWQVALISRRQPHTRWDDDLGMIHALDDAALVINCSGKSVNCRYNLKNRGEILRSRTQTTTRIGEMISRCQHPPRLWVNLSTATIYRDARDRPMTEAGGELGQGFSVDVARQWESAFFAFRVPSTRQVALRTAIVLGAGGGASSAYINLVRFGLGGMQGNGNQMLSWIHIEDVYRAIRFILEHDDMEGIYNLSSPNPLKNRDFMRTLRKAMHIPAGLPAPKWLLEIGAPVIGTEPELVLKSRWVLPERLLEQGFSFRYPDLSGALQTLV